MSEAATVRMALPSHGLSKVVTDEPRVTPFEIRCRYAGLAGLAGLAGSAPDTVTQDMEG